MRSVLQAALVAAASTIALVAPVDAQTRRAAASAVPVSPERAGLLAAQPTVVGMALTAYGWIKACADAAQPTACGVAGAFAMSPGGASNLQITIGTAGGNGTRPVAVTLPLDVSLRPGFTIMLESGEAILGDYTTCGAVGCSGEVGLAPATYQQLLRAKRFGILVGNATDRALRLDVPLEDFAAVVAGPATPAPEITRRREVAAEQVKLGDEKRRSAGGPAPGSTPQ